MPHLGSVPQQPSHSHLGSTFSLAGQARVATLDLAYGWSSCTSHTRRIGCKIVSEGLTTLVLSTEVILTIARREPSRNTGTYQDIISGPPSAKERTANGPYLPPFLSHLGVLLRSDARHRRLYAVVAKRMPMSVTTAHLPSFTAIAALGSRLY